MSSVNRLTLVAGHLKPSGKEALLDKADNDVVIGETTQLPIVPLRI